MSFRGISVDGAQFCWIMQGKTCTVETADILLKYFGLELVEKKMKEKNKVK